MSCKPRTLFSLIEDINKSIFLPHIQRPFVKVSGIDIGKHLLLFDRDSYFDFRNRRLDQIKKICEATVNPECIN